MGFFEIAIYFLLAVGGKAYVDVPYKGYPHINALFLNEYHCNQVKTKKQYCVRLDDEYVGLIDKEK